MTSAVRRRETPLARLARRLGLRREGGVLLLLFRGLLVSAVAVLVIDFRTLGEAGPTNAGPDLTATPSYAPRIPGVPSLGIPEEDAMTFDLVAEGRLLATGTITPGTAERFQAELAKRGGYVATIVLESPGGSVRDAAAMARLIRQAGFSTEVVPGGYCASSCPLVLAGGVERRVGEGASIGVHQVFAPDDQIDDVAAGMDEAQRISAENQRLLVEMGIDPELWIIAMETPKEQLHFLTTEELTHLRLATAMVTAR